MDFFGTDCIGCVSSFEGLKRASEMAVSWMNRGTASLRLPSLARREDVSGEMDRLTAWMSKDPDLVHSDVTRMTLQRDGFKYDLQYTGLTSVSQKQLSIPTWRSHTAPNPFLGQVSLRTRHQCLPVGEDTRAQAFSLGVQRDRILSPSVWGFGRDKISL